MIAFYAAHVLGGAAWVGGLPMLLLAIYDLRSARGHAAGAAALELLHRFSSMAFVAVGVIILSGVANTAFRVGANIDALITTPYGALLGIKLLFVILMLGLAAYNRFVAMPRLLMISQDERCRPLIRSISLEIALAALVLAAAAVLGITAPPY